MTWDESPVRCEERKKPDTKNCTLCDSASVMFRKRQDDSGGDWVSSSQGSGVDKELDYAGARGSFPSKGTVLYLDYGAGYTTTHLSKFIELYT